MEYVQQVMDQMPPRYFTSFPPPRREKHAEALGNLGEDGLSAVFVELESAGQEAQACARVTVIAFDVPGLFAVLTGTMAVFGCEIYSGLSCTAVPQSAGGYRPLSDQ
ncbi:MAG: hypothetical protein D6B26_06650, partial [Spirochaetaceae bacterium]